MYPQVRSRRSPSLKASQVAPARARLRLAPAGDRIENNILTRPTTNGPAQISINRGSGSPVILVKWTFLSAGDRGRTSCSFSSGSSAAQVRYTFVQVQCRKRVTHVSSDKPKSQPSSQPRPQPTAVPPAGVPLKRNEPTVPRPVPTGVPGSGVKRFDGYDGAPAKKR